MLGSHETASGRGSDVKFVDLSAGQVEISVSGNGEEDIPSWSEDSVASASLADEWSGRSLITVGGDGFLDSARLDPIEVVFLRFMVAQDR